MLNLYDMSLVSLWPFYDSKEKLNTRINVGRSIDQNGHQMLLLLQGQFEFGEQEGFRTQVIENSDPF